MKILPKEEFAKHAHFLVPSAQDPHLIVQAAHKLTRLYICQMDLVLQIVLVKTERTLIAHCWHALHVLLLVLLV